MTYITNEQRQNDLARDGVPMVEARVGAIKEAQGDCEDAHFMEDALHYDVLAVIADGRAPNPQKMAEVALRTSLIDFERWYA